MASSTPPNGSRPPGPPSPAAPPGATPTTVTATDTTAGTDVWQRWQPALNLVLAAVLALTTILALIDPSLTATQRLVMVGTVLLLGIWHWRLVAVRPDARCYPWLMVLYLVGASACYVVLTGIHPIFTLLGFFLYAELFALIPVPGAVVLAGPLTLLVWWRGATVDGGTFQPDFDTLLPLILTWLATGVMAMYVHRIIEQSYQRRQLIEDLAATRDELARAERQAGVVEERQRLAREIHDTLAQGFASIVLHLEAAEAALPPGNDPVQHHLDQARRTARDSLGEARRLVWALRPASLEDSSLIQALTRLTARWSEESGVAARVVLAEAASDLPPEVEVTLLRAAQEALANVRKHARASAVTLTLTIMADLVTLDILDDGAGFAPGGLGPRPAGGSGFGLISLRERVERLNGTLDLESTPGGGTTIAIAIPIASGLATGIAAGIGPEQPAQTEGSIP